MSPRAGRRLSVAREEMGDAYLGADMVDAAITAYTRTLTGRERVMGARHPDTMATRASLAHAYRVD